MESQQQPDTTEIRRQTAIVVAEAHALFVTSAEEYTLAAEFVAQRIQPVLKMIDALLGPAKEDAHKMWKRRCADIDVFKGPLETGKGIINGKLLVYRREEQERARAEQVRLQEEARRMEEEKRLAEAAELEARGKKEEAETAIERPLTPFLPVVKPDIPKVKGVTARKLPVKWRVVDRSKIPAMYFKTILDEDVIDGKVKSEGLGTDIPGIQVYQEETMAIGAGR